MIDDARFARIMTLMAETLPMYGRSLTDRNRELYWRALADLTDDEFETAAVRCMRELKAFPTPADLLERRPNQPDLEVQAARAFQAILRAPRYQENGSAYWSEREIATKFGRAAADAFVFAGATGGFRSASDPDRERFIRRDFVTAFVRIAKSDPATLAPEPASALQPGIATILGSLKTDLTLPTSPRPSAEDIARKKSGFLVHRPLAAPTHPRLKEPDPS